MCIRDRQYAETGQEAASLRGRGVQTGGRRGALVEGTRWVGEIVHHRAVAGQLDGAAAGQRPHQLDQADFE